MSRMLEVLVYGVIASAQLMVALSLLGLYTQSTAPAVLAHATIYTDPQSLRPSINNIDKGLTPISPISLSVDLSARESAASNPAPAARPAAN